MRITKQNKNTWLFIGFLLLSGIINLLTRTDYLPVDVLMVCIHDMILIGLIMFWMQSLRTRLLISGARTYMICIAGFMILYMLVRSFKYNIVYGGLPERYAVYFYRTPQMFIPALFLMTCIRIRRGEERGKWNEALLLIPAGVLSLMAMTNDIHSLVYRPHTDLSQFAVKTGTYTYGPGLYLLYVWMILITAAGLIMLFKELGHRSPGVIRTLVGIVILWFVLVLFNLLVIDRNITHGFRMFSIPEIDTFCMLGILEVCVRSRLIPYNENYSGSFSSLRIPAVITDLKFQPVYSSKIGFSLKKNELEQAVKDPVALSPDQKLYGKKIRGGYVFWTENESAVHMAQERIIEANELIEQENDLILAETEQKEKDAYLRSRHHIYHEIAEELYPCQKRIGQLLDLAVPGTEDFKEKMARVSVLNAYVKRKTNLLLLAAENETLGTGELFLALKESANYFSIAGLQTTVMEAGEKHLPSELIISMYDAFETAAEQLVGKAASLMVSWSDAGLCLAAQTSFTPDISGSPLSVRLRRSDDTLYIDILAEEGGETA